MKHTPAPWVVEEDSAGILVTAAKGGMSISVTIPGRKPDATDKANAKLIAAAPDLLAALEECALTLKGFLNQSSAQEIKDSFEREAKALTKSRYAIGRARS